MTRTKIFIAFAMTVAGVMTAAAPASAWFRDERPAPKEPGHCESIVLEECGTNLAPIGIELASGSRFTCPTEKFHVKLWRIEEKEPQNVTKEGPHLLITWLCSEGEVVVGETKSVAKLEECSVQLEQEKLQTTGVKGKVETECVLKAAAGLCVVKILGAPANQGLGETILTDIVFTGEKHEKMGLLLKFAVTGINAKASSKVCGFTETKEGKLTGDLDIFGVLWV